MEEDGEWAGNIELQALSVCFNVNIKVYQYNAPTLQMLNTKGKTIHLSYHNGEHYNSVIPLSDREVLKIHDSNYSSNLISKNERIIMESTGIDDIEMIRMVLKENWNDVNATIDFLVTQKYQTETKVEKEVEMTNTERKIMNLSGLKDLKMIKRIYQDMGNDLDATIDYIKMNKSEIEEELKNVKDEDDFLNDYVNKVMELTQYYEYERIKKLLNEKQYDLDKVVGIILNEQNEKAKKKQLTNKERKIQQKKEEEDAEKAKKLLEKTKTVNI